MSHVIRPLKGRRQDVPAGHFLVLSSRHSRGHSSRELKCPKVTPPPDDSTTPRLFPRTQLPRDDYTRGLSYLKVDVSVPSKTGAISYLLDHRLHSWRALCRQDITCFKRVTTLILMQTVTAGSRDHSSNQEHSPGRYEKNLKRANHAVTKFHMTRINNNDSHGIYTLGAEPNRRTKEEKSTKERKEKKKEKQEKSFLTRP